ncbi:FMN-dependent dehydrogenase [Corynascus novoguineensis]|uniref:FMN-dependent dehydrogenase n=1 Tax=Corynascus novoguineensis TaxID=1126955 RepID=A0AAN7CYQ4_9PEZI|nr:FMN-dependent dehydrogenase [Corynascus novoguineensis]
MSGPQHKDGDGSGEGKPPYGQYQLDLYAQAMIGGKKPVVTTDPNKLEQAAKEAMTPEAFNYVFGGAGEQATMHANRLAFRQWKLIPRMLRPTVPRDLRVNLFGKTYDTPLLMAPVGVQAAYHPDGEKGVATACASLGVPFIYSTAATTPLEEVASAADTSLNAAGNVNADAKSPPRAPRWFQLYWPLDDAITASLLERARAAGCDVLVVTLDTFTMSWRPLDLDGGYLPFARGEGNALGFSDPVFRRKFAAQFDGDAIEDNIMMASRFWLGEVFSGHAHRWEDLATLRRLWGDGPIVLKGVLSVQDAEMAVRCGMDGIVVSNHGGRQMDGAVPSLEVLPEIVDAVGDRLTVLFDSGIRTGVDVLKALSLGAKAVLVGRPVIYGLGAAGTDGARHILAGLLADIDQSMGLAGLQSVPELNRSILRKINYGGDVKSSL